MNAGFTYIEALIAMSIMVVISLALADFLGDMFSLNKFYTESISAQESARRAVRLISEEVRVLSPSNAGAYPITQAEASNFGFYSDIDRDSYKEKIRYFVDGNMLVKGTIEPSGNPLSYNPAAETLAVIAHDLANGAVPVFSYYDTNYDGTTVPLGSPVAVSSVRLLKITLVIDHDALNPPRPITITTQITMRNIKDNL